MQYAAILSALAALSAGLTVRQAPPADVDVILEPSYGCPGSDPLARVPEDYLDGACHSIGAFNSTQSRLSADASTIQTLTFFADDDCKTVAATLSNVASYGALLADGSCHSAPEGESFKALTYIESKVA